MTIVESARDEVVGHARATKPRECCGILIGRAGEIHRAVRARNLAESATRFEIDPRDHLVAIHAARSEGLEVVGFYHSHPHSDPWPSETDLAESNDARAVHLIVGLKNDEPVMKLFRLDEQSAEELPLQTRVSASRPAPER